MYITYNVYNNNHLGRMPSNNNISKFLFPVFANRLIGIQMYKHTLCLEHV